MSTELPLTDYRSRAPHDADECPSPDKCRYCGCCVHSKTLRVGCKVDDAPVGMYCPGDGCGCEGRS